MKVLKNKYTELQKYIEDIMKEKQEIDKNERKKKNKLNELISENKGLKKIINNKFIFPRWHFFSMTRSIRIYHTRFTTYIERCFIFKVISKCMY